MKLDLNKELDRQKFETRVKHLLDKRKKVELKEIVKARSLSQNAYVHVLFSLFGMEFGYTLEESKIHAKRKCNFMHYEKNGEKFLKKTSKLDKKEMTDFIEWFRNYAGMKGCYLPSSEEYLRERFFFDSEIERYKEFM